MQTWVTLTGGTKWAFRLDGFITRTCESLMSSSTALPDAHFDRRSYYAREHDRGDERDGLRVLLCQQCRRDPGIRLPVPQQRVRWASTDSVEIVEFECMRRPRLIRVITSKNWSIHDLVLVDCEYYFAVLTNAL